MSLALSALVHGRVQGVFFRAFVSSHAHALGLKGYVRNLEDGAFVEVWAEGERAQLENLLALLRVGLPRARVEQVEVEWTEEPRGFRHFEIY